jgi:hypothetical protein
MSNVLEQMAGWIEERRSDLESRGLETSLSISPQDRDNRSSWVDLDSAARMVRLTVWDSGEGVLSVGSVTSGESILDKQFERLDSAGLEAALEEAVEWAIGAP